MPSVGVDLLQEDLRRPFMDIRDLCTATMSNSIMTPARYFSTGAFAALVGPKFWMLNVEIWISDWAQAGALARKPKTAKVIRRPMFPPQF